jgi:hypothetical protein
MTQNNDRAASSTFADAEKVSVMPGGGTVPFRLPAGALSYLDRQQYISNMEILAYYPSINLMIFGDEHSCLWAKGKRRLIAFQGGFVDITEPTKATVIGESTVGLFQSCVYNSRLKKWIRVVAHQMPLTPGTRQYPRGKYHDDYAKKSIDDPGFRGIKTYDVTNPEKTECSTNSKQAGRVLASTVLSMTAADTVIWPAVGTTSCAWKAPSASTATA